jgi:hypothetical protein
LVASGWPSPSDARDPLFPPDGCSPTGIVNSCRTWAPAPVGDPTEGTLTDALREGPLDPPDDPLGIDAPAPRQRAPLLTPARDRLGVVPRDALGVGR